MGSKNKKNKGQKNGVSAAADAENGGRRVITDIRFASSQKDPRFQDFPKHKSKVTIDSRFRRMFTDKNFSTSSACIDKRGKAKKDDSSQNPLKHYYSLHEEEGKRQKQSEESSDGGEGESESESDREELKKVDTKLLDSDSRSGESESSSDEGEEDEDELDNDGSSTSTTDSDEDDGVYSEEEDTVFQEENVPEIDKETSRLAVVNMDWDQVRAVDLYVLLSSFLPKGGQILKVSIYPSEFGLRRMGEEAVHGPVGLFDDENGKSEQDDHDDENGKNEDDDDDDDGGDEIDNKKLRAYELSRLRYYFAVVECDSIATADYLYKTCDGTEFERSSNNLDLRFIPDSMEFKHEARDYATEAPANYEGIDFQTQALQLSKINLTWDENEPQRSRKLKRKFDANEESEYKKAESELKEYIAASDDSDEDEDEDDDDNGDGDRSAKRQKKEELYRALLQSGDGSDDEDEEEDDQDMEVTFNTGLEDISKKILEKKDAKSETVWESYLRKRREKKKARKNRSKDSSEDESSDDDGEPIVEADDFFTEEPSVKRKEVHGKKARKGKKVSEREAEEAEAASRAELELLLAEDEGVGANLKGYNLKHKKAKGKKGREVIDEGKIPTVDYDDPRFSSLFTSPNFALDPTDPQFKRSAAYAQQVAQKHQKGDMEENDRHEHTKLPGQARETDGMGIGKDEALVSDRVDSKKEKQEMSMLLKSVKMKSKQVQLPRNGKMPGRKMK